MDGHVVALLVGINEYLPPVSALYGCRNDIAAVEEALRARLGERLVLRTLLDEQATRDNVTDSIREHLGTAGPNDTALFVYAGHGSEEPAPPQFAKTESTNRIQTLMLYDCGRRVDGKLRRALADKELAVLIGELASKAGHVAVILDCCSSGGGTRDPFARSRGWQPEPAGGQDHDRDIAALADARPSDDFLEGTLEAWHAPSPRHVALSACASWEKAKEFQTGDAVRGAFSVALVESLEALGESTTYRTLLATVASRVGRSAADQHPELHPLDWGGPGDELFLDGAIPPVQSTFTVTRSSAGLTVDAGLVHGMRPPVGDEAFVLACTAPDGTHAGMVRIAEVSTGDSTVEPIEWTPLDVAYAAVVAEVPLPPAEVAFDQPIPLIADAIASCGPSGGPSPHVRVADENRAAPGVRFRVRSSDVGIARIARPDGSPLTDDIAVDNPAGALLAVRRLEHFSRWETIRGLGNHPSPLRESVALEVFDAIEGETTRPDDRHARPAAAFYHLEYRRDDDGRFLPPLVFLEINNTTSNDLFVAVLDLTDRFKCSAVVPTCKLAAGQSVSVGGSAPIPIHLPPGRSVEPGAKVRDWLKLIVSNAEFDASAFDLPALDDPAPDRPRGSRATRWGTIERIAARAVSRDFGGEPPPTVAHWAASTFEFETVVP